jgi:translation initiation factor IF-3
MTISKPPFKAPRREEDSTRVNESITADRVRLIDENGEMLGVFPTKSAIEKAYDAGLDLVEVSPNADPPVCKILDYGKYKYEQQKKANEARKKQKTIEVKEVKIRPGIEDHDFNVKMKAARRFLENGDKVKVTMRFRGREMAHQDIGMAVLERMKSELADISKIELDAKLEGRQIIMILSSNIIAPTAA